MAKTKELKDKETPINTSESRPRKTLGKKAKIIICVTCLVVIITSAIIGIVVATNRRFSNWTELKTTYNNHENMRIVSPSSKFDTSTISTNDYMSNGTVILKDNSNGLYGLYSYVQNKMLIPAEYTDSGLTAIDLIHHETGEPLNKQLFLTTSKSNTDTNELSFYNDNGERLSITTYDQENDVTYGYIKERNLNLSSKGSKVKVKSKNHYNTKKIEITNITYNESYEIKDKYHYEIWTLTDTNGNEYKNIYSVTKNEDRELIQTINHNIGTQVNSTKVEPVFHTNGDISFLAGSELYNSKSLMLYFTVFDENFNEEETNRITIENIGNIKYFRVGKYMYVQTKIPASQDKYDFAEINHSTGETQYFRLDTSRINLKNGKFSNVDFDYYIDNYNSSFNPDVTQLEVRKVTDKRLGSSQLLLVNENLRTKKTNYKITEIKELLSDEVYLVTSPNGYYLIDEKFKEISFLGQFDDYFTTKNAIILRDNTSGYAYVCDMKGVVVAKYYNNNIVCTGDDYYYMVLTQTTKDGVNYEEKYLENLGVRQENPIYSQAENATTYEYEGKTYCGYSDKILDSNVSIITRIRQDGSNYIYEFYNIDGDLLLELNNFDANNRPLTVLFDQEDYFLLQIAVKGDIKYTILLDR